MKFLKLFPVALAAFALASCSNDETFGLNDDQPQKDPTKLYAQIEDLTDGETGDITRSGFVYSYDAEKPNGQVFVWTADDKVKLYDDNQNWRPQIWQYSEAATIKYAQSGDKYGFAVFESNITGTVGNLDGVKNLGSDADKRYTNAYGVMPYTLAEFVNEKRTKLSFDFSSLQYYATGLTDENGLGYNPGKLSKAPIPLWGVANGNEMQVKYLTGILKVDIDNIENTLNPDGTDPFDAVATTHQFLIIQAEDAANAGNGFYMHPTSDINGLASVDFTPDVAGAVPTVSSIGTGATKTDLTDAAMNAIALANIPNDLIVVDLGNCTGRVQVSVPLMPGAQKIKAYVKKDVDVTGATVNLQNPKAVVDEAKPWTVQAGKYYRIQDPGLVRISTLNNPYSVAQYIKTMDPQQTRDWTLQLEADVDVKTGGAGADPNNYVLDLSTVTLKHNVTITFKGTKGFKKNADDDVLVVKTAASANDKYKLTINNSASSDLKILTVDAANAGPVVLTGDFNTATKTININGPKVTLKDVTGTGATVNAKNVFTIDNSGKTIGTVNIATGCTKVNDLNGTITTVTFDATDKIAAEVEIATTGNAHIGTVAYANVPNNGAAETKDLAFTQNVKFTSVWSGVAGDADATVTAITGTTKDGNVLISAAQLAGYDFTSVADVRILATTIDLSAAKWTPIAKLSGGTLDGNINVLPNTSTKVLAPVSASIEGMKYTVNAEGNWGLFADVQKNVSNLTIKNVTVDGSNTGSLNATTLAGKTSTNAVTLTNVAVENINIALTGKYADGKNQSIGGIVGTAASATTLKSCTYKDVTFSGNAALGGFVGKVYNEGSVTFGGAAGSLPSAPDGLCSFSGTNTFTPIDGNYEFDPTYAKIGTYVGSANPVNAADQAKVTFYLAAAPSTTITASAKAPYDKWTTVTSGAIKRWTINRGLNEIGFSGITGDNIPAVAHADWVVTVWIPATSGTNVGKYVGGTARSYKIDATLYNQNAKPADYNTAGVYYLNYFDQYLQ